MERPGPRPEPAEALGDRPRPAADLEHALTGGRCELLDQVDYKISGMSELVREFMPRSLLFLGEEERALLEDTLSDERMEERVQEIRRLLSTPQSLVIKELVRLDPLGISELFLTLLSDSRAGLTLY